jgi:hypothetical protein
LYVNEYKSIFWKRRAPAVTDAITAVFLSASEFDTVLERVTNVTLQIKYAS